MRDPANAGQNPPAAGALHSSICYSDSSEEGQRSYSPNHPTPPVLWPSPPDVRDPLWWQSHKPDLVILGLWTRPKYDPVRRAALSATPRVIERADSDGMRTASCGLLTYAKRRFDYFRDRTYRWPFFLSIPASIFYSFASILATPWIEYRLRKTLQLLPSILVETPHATTLWKSLATRLGINPQKIHCVPHPIQADIFKFDPAIPKKNQIISVGRWESYQKNLPLLLETLRTFLDKNPSWTSLVIGSGLPTKSPHCRITLLPSLTPKYLARLMHESRVFLFSSRYESFLLAGAEALTAGCSVIGPEGLPSTSYFLEFTSKNQPLKLGKARLSVNNNKRSPPNKEIRLSSLQSCRATFCFSPISVAKNILKIMSKQESVL
jgi:glycosyltransferase involved in cell wall biosynthesis